LTLRRHLRDNDLLARVGGDEFAVILREGSSWSAEAVARKLVLAVRDEVTPDGLDEVLAVAPQGDLEVIAGTRPMVTVSVGVAAFESLPGKDPAEVLKAADAAMYLVKRSGRNGYAVHGAAGGPHHARPRRNLDLASRQPVGSLRS
ncbi:MAG TPA: GGDEF domain-containing protein, partial [Acidimicrobiales bacterium]|nr:GGDEF domain-containing protein [Acidimicrobiales bacterium]